MICAVLAIYKIVNMLVNFYHDKLLSTAEIFPTSVGHVIQFFLPFAYDTYMHNAMGVLRLANTDGSDG